MPVKPQQNNGPTKKDLFNLAEDIIANVDVGIYLVHQGRFAYASPLFLKLSGYSEAELIGHSSLDHVHPEDRDSVRERAVKRLKGECSGAYEYRFIRRDRQPIWVLEMVTPIDYRGERATLGSFMDITDRKSMEERLRESEKKYRTILEEIDEAYYEVDLSGNFTFVNEAVCRRLGYSREELIGMNYRGYTPEKEYEEVFKTYVKVFQEDKTLKWYPFQNIRKDGTVLSIEASISPLRNKEGETIGFRGITTDITERKRMEETIRESEERYRTIIDEMEEWFFETDPAGQFLFVNDAFLRAMGYTEKELVGQNFRILIRQEDGDLAYKIFNQVYQTGEAIKDFPHEFTLPNGIKKIAEISIFPKRNREGKFIGFRGVGHDITARKRTEEQLNFMATHDPLTALPNRMLLNDRLKMAMSQAKRNNHKIAVLMLDLDRFKRVNDSLGHSLGDQLLIEVGRRLTELLRQTDTVARMGGDEFLILLPEIQEKEDPAEVAQKILRIFEKPLLVDGCEIQSATSIGIAIYPDDCQDIDSLLKNSDLAMYQAKTQGRNGFRFFADINLISS
jgi:diguanylate cyclase (GGDEF)-like protein/PAS domain S-box-containing protein